jgi:hypothetical protein
LNEKKNNNTKLGKSKSVDNYLSLKTPEHLSSNGLNQKMVKKKKKRNQSQ